MSSFRKPRVILDTNVLLRGLAAVSLQSPAARCVQLVDLGAVEILLSDTILQEIKDVLTRPQVRAKLTRLTDERVEEIIRVLSERSTLYTHVPSHIRYERDPKDEPFLNLAIEAQADYLVTYDLDMLEAAAPNTPSRQVLRDRIPDLRMVTPEQFLQLLGVE